MEVKNARVIFTPDPDYLSTVLADVHLKNFWKTTSENILTLTWTFDLLLLTKNENWKSEEGIQVILWGAGRKNILYFRRPSHLSLHVFARIYELYNSFKFFGLRTVLVVRNRSWNNTINIHEDTLCSMSSILTFSLQSVSRTWQKIRHSTHYWSCSLLIPSLNRWSEADQNTIPKQSKAKTNLFSTFEDYFSYYFATAGITQTHHQLVHLRHTKGKRPLDDDLFWCRYQQLSYYAHSEDKS